MPAITPNTIARIGTGGGQSETSHIINTILLLNIPMPVHLGMKVPRIQTRTGF